MNDVARSIAPAGAVTPSRQLRPSRALALRDAQPLSAASDREFLAPVLEILETPASPVRVAFLWIICALVVVGLAWAYFGRIDIIASAQGKFQPTGRVKVIEPVDTGRVAAIHVSNDSVVKAGDVLVELDPSAAEADVERPGPLSCPREAESLRRREALAAARARVFLPPAGDRLARGNRPEPARTRRARAGGGSRPARRRPWPPSTPRRSQKASERDMLEADDRDPAQSGRYAAGARRHARQAGRIAVRRQVRRHRRHRDLAVSADPARHAGGSARFRDDGARRHRARRPRRPCSRSSRIRRGNSTTRSDRRRTTGSASPRRRLWSTT